ncbi:MAG: glycosyltransferase [Burkholderiales bacterium]|nr:MAG: glycosyltransferase [Burkholderiales bacterium]
MPDRCLTVIPSVPVWTDGEHIVFDRKFYDGLLLYVERWPGPVSCVVRRTTDALPAFGAVRKTAKELPFAVQSLYTEERVRAEHLAGAAVVLAAADDFNQLHVSALCRGLGIKCAYVIEYVPETRHQIVAIESPNLLTRLRRDLFVRRTERRRRKAFDLADGIQANGTAACGEYRKYANCMLYFDTRMGRDAMISDDALSSRLEESSKGGPLRLAFSGRLIGMKGADHLVRVAAALRDSGVPFHLTVYGTGDLESRMRADIRALELDLRVTMRGAVDFHDTLVPEIKSSVDAYVMLHRQSDPSCTYLETLSCGIPIVGYANKALSGILEMADVGCSSAMDDVAGIAAAIRRLDSDRALLSRQSRAASGFARRHSFEETFRNRVDHLLRLAGDAPDRPAVTV